ncbi:MAG: PEP-CTERM sorting domain-containing protein [Planctomycetota bacterium]|nr:PEP-CTERM sorting domain-containing protein [Planctomycetota bacterium]
MPTLDGKAIRMGSVYLAAIFCATILLTAGGVLGDEIKWNNTAGGSFNLDTNWNPVQVPDADDTAVFDLAQTPAYDVTFNAGITNDRCHFRTDEVNMYLNGYTYILLGVNDYSLVVGESSPDLACVVMTGGTLQTRSAHVGLYASSIGILDVVGADMTMNIDEWLTVGEDGAGGLGISEGATVTSRRFHAGALNSGSNSTVYITGPDSSLTVTGEFFAVGDSGSASMRIDAGATARTTHAGGWIRAGSQAGSYGEIIVENDSLLDAESSPMIIGDWGKGSLTVAAISTAHSAGELFVAGSEGSSGDVLITAESEYVSDSVYISKIGDAGTGTLIIEDMSRFQGYSMVVGNRPTGDGTVTLYDSGSTLEVDYLRVGREGAGRLEVNDGRVAMGDVDPSTVPDGEVHIGVGGELGGTGTIACKVLNIAGEVRPGGTILPTRIPGILNIDGDFEQHADGTLVIEIGGTSRGDEYSVLDVSGEFTIGGALISEAINGYDPQLGDTFDILDWVTSTGEFDTIWLPPTPVVDWWWDTSMLYRTGEITVVPEPATLMLLGIGGLPALRSRKRG